MPVFQNVNEDDFIPASGLGKGKGKGRAATVNVFVKTRLSIDAAAGPRVRKKSRRKALADGNDESTSKVRSHMQIFACCPRC